ncbi:unnamed protein product [Cuscuta campestris]|uniref:Uncharacterized protein n=1 Tax=Cuscuta campestris TaxID=132261 RepID=A0A484LU87_9ASTE|nr:unnamed protein product [Cuscuta campestris]
MACARLPSPRRSAERECLTSIQEEHPGMVCARLPSPRRSAERECLTFIQEEHPDMNFRFFSIPKKTDRGATQIERVPVNPSPNKGKGKTRTKQVATTHPAAKRKRGENVPVVESLEELWVKMGRWLKEMDKVGPDALEQLTDDSPSRSSQLEEKLKRAVAHNRELQDLTARQLEEMANLSRVVRKANAEILQLKEENSTLMGEVS